MSKDKQQTKLLTADNRVKRYVFVVLALVLICVVIAMLCWTYYTNVEETLHEESKGYMLEISQQMANNINRNITDNFAAMYTIESSILQSRPDTISDFSAIANEYKQIWHFSKIMLLDSTGDAYDSDGWSGKLPINPSGDAPDRPSISVTTIIGRQPLLTILSIDSEEYVVFAIPTDIDIDNVGMKCMILCYELITFDQILSMNAFNGMGYAHIITKDGEKAVSSSSDNAFDIASGFINMLEKDATFSKGYSAEELRNNIHDGDSGVVELTIYSQQLYISYFALDEDATFHDWRLVTVVPADVINEKTDLLLALTLIISGCVVLAFLILFGCLILLIVKNRRKLERIAYVDEITGGNSIQIFYKSASRLLMQNKNSYAIIFINIEKFKLLNDQYGNKSCDQLLKLMYVSLARDNVQEECIGRLYADNYCMLVKYATKSELIDRILKWKETFFEDSIASNLPAWSFMIKFGIYVVYDNTIELPHMIDRAKLSMTDDNCEVYDNIKIAFYDEKVRSQLLREKRLENMMDKAIKNNEFLVYLQPKYLAKTERIGGAEALVRWQSQELGMIYPDEFIPLCERNGFIIKLDLYVFDKACALINKLIANDETPVKISVNCSHSHLKDPYFLDKYKVIADKYGIPKQYIEIEFTENIVFRDIQQFSEIVDMIHEAGFGCSMDDFGSGFSSLSAIQDLPVDTLKLDKIFFKNRQGDAFQRTQSVLSSIIAMAKSLSMTTVAEGVEDRLHVDMLKLLDCDMIQGYYFAKPMPIDEFEKLLKTDR